MKSLINMKRDSLKALNTADTTKFNISYVARRCQPHAHVE